jgi:hypothetical protein
LIPRKESRRRQGNDAYGPYMTVEISPKFDRRMEVIDADPFAGFI